MQTSRHADPLEAISAREIEGASVDPDRIALLTQTVEQLHTALSSRIVIEQAKGVLAERFQISLDEAFALLRYSARTARTSLQRIARSVIERGDITPDELIVGLLRPEKWVGSPRRASVPE